MSQELSWNDWLSHNLARNCASCELRAEPIKNGFSEEQADEKMLSASARLQKNQLDQPATVTGSNDDQLVNFPGAIDLCNGKVEMYGVDGFLSVHYFFKRQRNWVMTKVILKDKLKSKI